jgi:hypothetical protein
LTRREQKENNGASPKLPKSWDRRPTSTSPPTKAVRACGGDLGETVKALIVANHFLETELDARRVKVSTGYARRRIAPARDCKD